MVELTRAIERVGKLNGGRWQGSGTLFVPPSSYYPHWEPICGYLRHPTHAKYRSVKTAVATHEALVVLPPLVPARAGRPPSALMPPVPCVSRRRIIMLRTSCLYQQALWPPRCRHPPPPPQALKCWRLSTQNSHSAHCIPSPSTAASLVIWSAGAPPQGRWGCWCSGWRSVGRCCFHRGRRGADAVDVESTNIVDRYSGTCRR